MGGDALVRKGLRVRGAAVVAKGFVSFEANFLVVPMVKWDLFKLIGVYVAVFAVVSLLVWQCVF